MANVPDRLRTALADRYRLERELGQGGMATVYLADDLRHKRRVAIKVLRPELSAVIGADRFLAEIETTANLQHPHILPLFDSGEVDGTAFYVMPFVEGETLRDRLGRDKQLPVAEAVRLATEVASALDYAHRQGIIHRDIKPENVLLHDGRALVADFGIALAASRADGSGRMTETGMSLGTPHYMSPEQAMGERDLDARSDVYALGAMTFEMLAGEPPFTGPTAQAIVAKVMTAQPEPVTSYRKTVPPHVAAAVATALEKLPADRFPTAAAYAEALANPTYRGTGAGSVRPSAGPPVRLTAALAAVALLATAAAAWGWLRSGAATSATPPIPSRLALRPPDLGGAGAALLRQVALSPDGATVYFTSGDGSGSLRTLRQRLDEEEPTVVPALEPNLAGYRIAPDGRSMYAVNGVTQTAILTSLTGGGSQGFPRVGDASVSWTSFAAWGADGTLWLSAAPGSDWPLFRIDADRRVDSLRTETAMPAVMQVLDERTLLAIAGRFGAAWGRVVLIDSESGASTPVIEQDVVEARYAVGFIVYVLQSGDMEAVPFDLQEQRVTGPPTRIASGVSLTGTGVAQFDVAANGTIVYLPEEPRSLVFVDRVGGERPATQEMQNYHSPRFSPDGRTLAVDFTAAGERDVWLLEVASGLLRRATLDRTGHDPTWAPDGSLTYITASDGPIGILRSRPGSTAPAESLYRGPTLGWTGEWLADGSALVTVGLGLQPGTGEDIGILRNGGAGPLEPLVATPASEMHVALSPDNRWIAFSSTQTGREEVHLRRLDGTGSQLQVSARGGTAPAWSPDGRELYYVTSDSDPRLEAVTLRGDADLAVASRTTLFGIAAYIPTTPHRNYDVSPDGRSFVFVRRNSSARIMVIQQLPALVEQLRGGAP